jgi:hypothetical protein
MVEGDNSIGEEIDALGYLRASTAGRKVAVPPLSEDVGV